MINTIILTLRCLYQFRQTSYCWRSKKIRLTEWNEDLNNLNIQFETGKITRDDFLVVFKKHIPDVKYFEIQKPGIRFIGFSAVSPRIPPNASKKNTACFIEQYRCDSHREVRAKHRTTFYSDFYQCFEQVLFFSFEVEMQTKFRNFQLCFKHELQFQTNFVCWWSKRKHRCGSRTWFLYGIYK
jgi:putative hydrolase of the HAD superfamily